MSIRLSEQEQQRRRNLKALIDLGIDDFPAQEYPVNTTAKDIHDRLDGEKDHFQNVCSAGRIMSRRATGSASFLELQDATGRIQAYVKRDDLCPGEDKTLYNTVFKKLLDIGDIVGITGFVFTTQTGEISIHAQSLTVLTKSLRPLPIVKEAD